MSESSSEFANGAAEIGAVIGKSESQTYHLLRMGFIRCARKVGHQHICHIPTLKREFGADELLTREERVA
jgi:hypothetical protein